MFTKIIIGINLASGVILGLNMDFLGLKQLKARTILNTFIAYAALNKILSTRNSKDSKNIGLVKAANNTLLITTSKPNGYWNSASELNPRFKYFTPKSRQVIVFFMFINNSKINFNES